MITLTCKTYRARVDGESVVLEIDDAQPISVVPQLISKSDVASRLQISVRKVEGLVRSRRLPMLRIDGSVRFKEEDVLRLLTENVGPKPRLLALPSRAKSEI
jgi:excisionase family DNA binding protein